MLRWLERLGPEWTVIHSLGVLNHPFKQWAEVDAVVVGPPGVLVLEVKGGRVARRQGVWEFTDRTGRTTRRREGPFDQAGGAHGAIRRVLLDSGALGRSQCSGYAVLLPDVTLGGQPSDATRNVLLDASSAWSAPSGVLTRWCRYWAGRTGNTGPLSTDDTAAVVEALRGDLDLRPALSLVAEDIEQELTRLTQEQGRVLRAATDLPRLAVAGRAGTGKTLLAQAEAQRLAAGGRRVLLTCSSPVLAGHLARAVGADVEVGAYDPVSGQADGVRLDKYDAVVVDETQDIGVAWVELVKRYADGGRDSGTWRLFYDPEQDLIGLPLDLTSALPDSAVRLKLTLNCRNTQQIAVATSILTRTQLDVEAPVPGPEVVARWWSTAEEHLQILAEEVRGLTESLPPGRIAVLTRHPLPARAVGAFRATSGVPVRRLSSGHGDAVTVATAEEFKGLEADAVVVAEINSLDTPTDRRHAYVACTRARAHLTMLLHESARNAYREGARWFGRMLTTRT
ncbi:ATP-binding domain-containing protein [Actinomycetospora aeridis]|uniref:ATP-binding domain-containing protein n=1 Tax=Actinomycetospora aeridis TaxID=3129231 RepID=A0ABU8NA96_9PSEU